MSTSKDASKKISAMSKEKTSSKTTSSKKEISTDRNYSKTKKEPEKDNPSDIIPSTSLTKKHKENVKAYKNGTTLKEDLKKISAVSKETTLIKTTVSKKEKATSRSEKVSLKSVSKVPSESTNVISTSKSKTSNMITKDISKPTTKSKLLGKKKVENRDESSSSKVQKTQYFPSKNLYSNALKYNTEIQEKISTANIRNEKSEIDLKPSKSKTIKSNLAHKDKKLSNLNSSRTVTSVIPGLKESVSQNATPISSRKSLRHVKSKISDNVTRESSPDTSSVSERPGTATLRKGSIVNTNIVGPEAPESNRYNPIKESILLHERPPTVTSEILSPANLEDNYEDDFESYDSDFEAYSSSEDNSTLAKISGQDTSSVSSSSENIPETKEILNKPLPTDFKQIPVTTIDDERSHDSGTFELPDFKHKLILDHLKESVKQKDNLLRDIHIKEKGQHSSLSDEGFEDQKSLQFINFAEAKKKCDKRRASQIQRKRGDDILSMIKLDPVSFTLFDLPAVPYDVFISSYGQNNMVQTSIQTGEDDIVEEIQTDLVKVENKWTQMPSKFSTFDQQQQNFWSNYKKEYLGVGNNSSIDIFITDKKYVNEKRLKLFLNQSVELIFQILAETNIKGINNINTNKQDIPFSSGYLQFNTTREIFSNTVLQHISVSATNINHILTVHVKNSEDYPDDFIKSIMSVWDISDLTTPLKILVSYGEICCATFSLECSTYIFAGQKDGAVSVWNIKDQRQSFDIPGSTPTFTTDIGSSHLAKVVSIQPINNDKKQRGYFEKNQNSEICTLDEEGKIIIWNLYTDTKVKQFTGDVVLIISTTICLQDSYPELPDLLCSDFILMNEHIYVSTNYGYILHYLIHGNVGNVKKFLPGTITEATCLEGCPFTSTLFLTGFLNGNIVLYSRNTERPLMTLRKNVNDGGKSSDNNSVQLIQWCKTRPFVLYAKDSQNTIHVWDLSKSDMYPEYSIPFRSNISCIKLSPASDVDLKEACYMLIGTKEGNIYLHLLNNDYVQESHEVYKEEVATFLDYASRL